MRPPHEKQAAAPRTASRRRVPAASDRAPVTCGSCTSGRTGPHRRVQKPPFPGEGKGLSSSSRYRLLSFASVLPSSQRAVTRCHVSASTSSHCALLCSAPWACPAPAAPSANQIAAPHLQVPSGPAGLRHIPCAASAACRSHDAAPPSALRGQRACAYGGSVLFRSSDELKRADVR